MNAAIVEKFGDERKCLKTTSNRGPTNRWLLEVLAVLKPNHLFFVKGYTPEKAYIADEQLRVKVKFLKRLNDMDHSVFSGLPLSLIIRRKSMKSMAFTNL